VKIKNKILIAVFVVFGTNQLLPAGDTFIGVPTKTIQNDTIYPAEIEIQPSVIQLDFSPSEFITKDITILNRGGQPLEIKKVKASCYCANAAIIHSTIIPFSLGKIRLSVNTQKLTDSLQRIDYTIWSNAQDSVFTFPVYLRRIEKDTLIHPKN
jgi:hypothetical protein